MTVTDSIRASFTDKPYPVPIELRPLWRIALLVSTIAIVAGNKKYLDLNKANILVWMLIRSRRWREYEDFLCGRTNELPLISVDTATYKAVEFSIAKQFLALQSSRLYLEEYGNELFEVIVRSEILREERAFLQENGRRLTEIKVKALSGTLK